MQDLDHGIDDMDALGTPAKSGIESGFCSHPGIHLGSAGDEDDAVADTPFNTQVGQLFHLSAMDVVMTDNRGNKDRLGASLNGGIDQFAEGHGGTQVMVFDAVFFDPAVLDIQNLTQTNTVFVFADSSRDDRQAGLFYRCSQDLLIQDNLLLRDLQVGQFNIKSHFPFNLNEAALCRVHDLDVDNLGVDQTELFRHFNPVRPGEILRQGNEELGQDGTVTRPLRFRFDLAAFTILVGFLQALFAIVLRIEFIDIGDFFGLTQGATANRVARSL